MCHQTQDAHCTIGKELSQNYVRFCWGYAQDATNILCHAARAQIWCEHQQWTHLKLKNPSLAFLLSIGLLLWWGPYGLLMHGWYFICKMRQGLPIGVCLRAGGRRCGRSRGHVTNLVEGFPLWIDVNHISPILGFPGKGTITDPSAIARGFTKAPSPFCLAFECCQVDRFIEENNINSEATLKIRTLSGAHRMFVLECFLEPQTCHTGTVEARRANVK